MPAEQTRHQGHEQDKQAAKRPAQVPGDAESPPKGSESKAAQKAPNHTDPTEPVRTAKDR